MLSAHISVSVGCPGLPWLGAPPQGLLALPLVLRPLPPGPLRPGHRQLSTNSGCGDKMSYSRQQSLCEKTEGSVTETH